MKASVKRKVDLQPNELVESDNLEDIPAGSVTEIIDLVGSQPKQGKTNLVLTSSNRHVCRFMELTGTSALQKVSRHSMLQRGMSFSHYSFAYADHFAGDSAEFSSDPFAVAIRNLHISVIPSNLPCRSKELQTLKEYMLNGIRNKLQQKPVCLFN